MPAASSPQTRAPAFPALLCRLWAGLECGVTGGVLVLAWLILHSIARKEYWWARFNIAGGLFYGTAVYSSGLGWATLSGAALLLFLCGGAGMLFGLLADPLSQVRNLVRACLYVGLLHAATQFFLWPAMGSFAALWFSWRATLPADLVLLLAFTRFPLFHNLLSGSFASEAGRQGRVDASRPEAAPPPPASPAADAPGETSSGNGPGE